MPGSSPRAGDRPDDSLIAADRTLRQFSGYTMKRAFHVIQSDLNAALAPLGLRMLSFSALVVVVDNPGLRQSQLAEVLAIERPNLVLVIDELERAGLICRNPSPDDRRAYALDPTEEGRALCGTAIHAVQEHEGRVARALAEPERQALIAALLRIETPEEGETSDG